MIVDHKSQKIIASGSPISHTTNNLEAAIFVTHKLGIKGKGVYLGTRGSTGEYSITNLKFIRGGYKERSSTSNYRRL